MYLKPQRLQEGYKIGLIFELFRRSLILRGEYVEALRSYFNQKSFFSDQNSGVFWDEKLENDSEKEDYLRDWRHKIVFKNLNLKKSILNLGIGSGFFEKRYIFPFRPKQFVGTDITNDLLNNLIDNFPNYVFRKEYLTSLSFNDDSFDQVILMEVLEHIKPSETFFVLSEIRRVLKKNGKFIVTIPINEGLERLLPVNPNSHMRIYSEAMLIFELKTMKFKIKKIYRESAFHNNFYLKSFINNFFRLRKHNNLVVICEK